MPSRSGRPDAIRTDRLLLRRATMADAEAMHRVLSNHEAMRFWSTLPHEGIEQTKAWLTDGLSVDRELSDDFVVECDGQVIGKLGAYKLPDFGYIFHPEVWGQGFASEALAAFIEHRRRSGGVELTADTDPRNAASIRLLQRHGFVETGRAERTWLVGDEWCDSIYWRLDL